MARVTKMQKIEEDMTMQWYHVVLIILLVVLAVLVALYFLGTKLSKKQEAQKAQMEAMKQVVSMLVIDKKKMKLKDAGLPDVVMNEVPKYMRRAKMCFVKAKIGPKIMTLIADGNVFDTIPTKKEVKVVISGIYITEIKSVRGGTIITPPKKKKFFDRFKKNKDNKQPASNNTAKKSTKKK